MLRVERWRIEELSLLLDLLAGFLREGRNPEWAGVFSHFNQETRIFLSEAAIGKDQLKRLVQNIKNCFGPGYPFPALVLQCEGGVDEDALNREFTAAKVRLEKALGELEKRLFDYLH